MNNRLGIILIGLMISATTAAGQQISIAATLNMAAGEAQSTVVPPNKKSEFSLSLR